MMKKFMISLKKILKICVSAILVLAVLQIIRFAIESHAFDVPGLKKTGNYEEWGECNFGNCVLVHRKNGMSTFPFVFGNRLYLYDIAQEKYKLVADTWFPFTEIGSFITSADNKAYYNLLVWEGSSVGGDIYYTDLGTTERGKVPEMASDTMYLGCSIYDSKIYYWKEYIDEDSRQDEEYGRVYVTDLDSKEEEIFMYGDIQYFKILGNTMYCYSGKDGRLHAVNLDTGNRKSYEFGGGRVWGIFQAENEEIFLEVELENDTRELKLVKLNVREGTIIEERAGVGGNHYKDGNVYSEDDYSVYKYCFETGREELCIDILKDMSFLKRKEYKSNIVAQWSYCDDYIAAEVYYYSDTKKGDHSELLVYDYGGKLLQKEELW